MDPAPAGRRQGQDRRRLIQSGWSVDLSWELAQELNMPNGPLAGVKGWDNYPVDGLVGHE